MKSNNTKFKFLKTRDKNVRNLYVHNTNRIKSILKLINPINVKAKEKLHNWCLDVNYIIHKRKFQVFRVDRFEE